MMETKTIKLALVQKFKSCFWSLQKRRHMLLGGCGHTALWIIISAPVWQIRKVGELNKPRTPEGNHLANLFAGIIQHDRNAEILQEYFYLTPKIL